MADNNNKNGQQINIELDADVAQGIYSNLAIINHSASEFVVDFVSIMPGVPKSKVKSRIILTPQHAKRLLKALADKLSVTVARPKGSLNSSKTPIQTANTVAKIMENFL